MTFPLRKFTLLIVALALPGCAMKLKPPQIKYDNLDFKAAKVEAPPLAPVRLVKVPQPLPLPGQLKPIEKRVKKPKDKSKPTERVKKANARARVEPKRDGYVNAIQVYPFAPGALYRLYTAPEQVSDIALQVGEKLVSVSAGDTVRWVVDNTKSGQGANEQVHILVKPTEADLKTNLVITTDRRSYHLELESFKDTYMASLSWRYPHDRLARLHQKNDKAIKSDSQIIQTGVSLQNLRFRYRVTGDTPPWRPKRVFDDGKKVYIEFPSGISQGEAPPLFVVGPSGDNGLVNYGMKGRYYVVDTLFAAAELRLGEKPQQVVRISRTDGARSNGLANLFEAGFDDEDD